MSAKSFALLVVFMCGSTSAMAYKLAPESQVFTAESTSKSFEIVNDSAEWVGLDLSIATIERNVDNVETNTNADEQFTISPAHFVLGPNAKQTVQVTWMGEANPTYELGYRLIVEEFAIKGKKGAAVSGLMNVQTSFGASLFVRRANAEPKVALESVRYIDGKKGNAGSLAITIQNIGNAQGTLKNCATQLSYGKNTFSVPAESLEQGHILAGNKRRFVTPWPAELPLSNVSVGVLCEVEPTLSIQEPSVVSGAVVSK